MNNINEKKAEIWCTRFNQLMKEQGYTQKSFLKEYKNKYGGGTQANISRWLRVGNVIQKKMEYLKKLVFRHMKIC